MNSKKSFWTTLPGILTGIAGLITAVTGMLALLYQIDIIGPNRTETENRQVNENHSQPDPTKTSDPRPEQKENLNKIEEAHKNQEEMVMTVVYKPRTGTDLPYDSKAVQSVMDLIEDNLSESGFRVYLPDQIKRIRERTAEMVVDEETAIRIARQEAGDVVVVVSLDVEESPTADGFNIISVTLNLKAYDATTGEHFAGIQDKGKTIAASGDTALQNGIAKVATKIGPRTVERLAKKMGSRFNAKRMKFVMLIFRNTSSEDQGKIENLLNNIGWKYRVLSQTGSYLEIAVTDEADPMSVKGKMRKALDNAGLAVIPSEMSGTRIIFDGIYTGTP